MPTVIAVGTSRKIERAAACAHRWRRGKTNHFKTNGIEATCKKKIDEFKTPIVVQVPLRNNQDWNSIEDDYFFLAPGKYTPNLILLWTNVTQNASANSAALNIYIVSRASCETKIAKVCNPKISTTVQIHITLIYLGSIRNTDCSDLLGEDGSRLYSDVNTQRKKPSLFGSNFEDAVDRSNWRDAILEY